MLSEVSQTQKDNCCTISLYLEAKKERGPDSRKRTDNKWEGEGDTKRAKCKTKQVRKAVEHGQDGIHASMEIPQCGLLIHTIELS